MKASELRIGNFVSTIDDKTICTSVKGFYGFPVSTGIINHNNNVNDFEYLKPIQLTEEWLIKFGLKLLRKDEFYDYTQIVYGKSIIKGDEDHSEKLVIYLPFNKCEIGEYNPREDDNSYLLNISIDYVHQLQNLFHSLSGMEL